MWPANYSLRYRLVGLLLVAVTIAWGGVSVTTYRDARKEIDSVLDAHLEQAASLLADQANHELLEIGTEGLGGLAPYSNAVIFQVWGAEGQLLVRSRNAPASRLSAQDRGFSDAQFGREHWRVYSARSPEHQALVQVAESREGRDRLTGRFIAHALWPLLIALPLLGLAVWLSVARALRPLRALNAEVDRRRASDLQPLPTAAVPQEVVSLVDHLNSLFERIRGTLQSERRFTSHAAHELRTPLAAIRAQAESAVDAGDGEARRRALENVIVACDRLSRVVSQLLTLARMDEDPSPVPSACCIDEVAARVIAELAPNALDRGVDIELKSAARVRVGADPDLLAILLRNLIDNAIAYGGTGGSVEVSITMTPSGVELTVIDNGPGISESELAQLGTPFFRGSQPGGTGTGLGLSIVRRIAERYGADLRFRSAAPDRGLRVTVGFPA